MTGFIERVEGFSYKFFRLENFSDYKDKVIFVLLNLMFIQSAVQFYKFLDVQVIKVACWPFFQSCGLIQSYVLLNIAPGYRPLYFSILFLIFTTIFYYLYKGKYGVSFLLSLVAFCYNLFPYIIFTDYYNPVVTYFNMYYFYTALIVFFSRHSRRELLAIFLALTYLFPGYSKLISEHWVVGIIPMPYVPNYLLPIFTNLTIFTQLVFPFIFLFGRGLVKRFSVYLQEIYHVYSATLPTVGFNFLYYNCPLLIILFLDDKLKISIRNFKNNFPAIIIFVIFIFLSNVRIFVPYNDSLTKEAIYGINVFASPYSENVEYLDANLRVQNSGMSVREFDPFDQLRQIRNIPRLTSYFPNMYVLIDRIQQNCIDDKPRYLKIKMETFYSSYLVVDEKDYCKLDYKPFSHNKWIKESRPTFEDLTKLNNTQRFFHAYRPEFELLYTCIFYLVVFYGFARFIKNGQRDKME
jgi:hypothetical protein